MKSWQPTYAKGLPVEGNFRGQGTYYAGIIVAVNDDGTFNINYDDGDKEKKVPASRLRMGGQQKFKQQFPSAAGKRAGSSMITFMAASTARNRQRHLTATNNPQLKVINAQDLNQLCDVLQLDTKEKELLVGVGLELDAWRRLPRSQIEQVMIDQ